MDWCNVEVKVWREMKETGMDRRLINRDVYLWAAVERSAEWGLLSHDYRNIQEKKLQPKKTFI